MSTRLVTTMVVSAFCALTAAIALPASSLALFTHRYERAFGEQPGVRDGGSITFFSGGLLANERGGRLTQYDPSTGAVTGQLSPAAVGLGEFASDRGQPLVAAGTVGGEPQVYVPAENGVAVLAPGGCGTVQCATLQNTWTGADTPNKSFLEGEGGARGHFHGLAFDGSAAVGDWAKGDVLVSTDSEYQERNPELDVVDVFRPGPKGTEEYITQISSATIGGGKPFLPFDIAVSELTGNVIVFNFAQNVLDIFEPTGLGQYTFVGELSIGGGEVTGLAVAGGTGKGAGDILVARSGGFVEELSPTGVLEDRIVLPQGGGTEGIALDPASGQLFVDDQAGVATVIDVFSGVLVLPDVAVEGTANVAYEPGPHLLSLDVQGSVNPDEAGPATCQFVWGATPALGNTAPCEGPGESFGNPVPEGTEPVAVHAHLPGLLPGATYFYRLQATNASGTNTGEESQVGQFVVPGGALESESVAEVTSASATLQASIDPNGSPTFSYFEYDTSAYGQGGPAHGARTPLVLLGAGTLPVQPSSHVQGLAAGVSYHYRLVEVSEVEVGGHTEPLVFYSGDHSFTTQRPGAGAELIDGRQWELVSPADKHGATIHGQLEPVQAAAGGGVFTFGVSSPTEPEPAGFTNVTQVFATRGAGGWSSRDISVSHESPAGTGAEPEYRFFSGDLSMSVADPTGVDSPLLSPEASEATPYTRNDACVSVGCYTPLVSGKGGEAGDVPPGVVFGGPFGGHVRFKGATPDVRHVLLSSDAELVAVPGHPTSGARELYEWSSNATGPRRLRLISVLPESEGGTPAAPDVYFGNVDTGPPGGGRPVSDDGTRVPWSSAPANGKSEVALYLRDTVRGGSGETIRLDVPQPGAVGGPAHALFQMINTTGTRVLFTDTARLTVHSSEAGADLYECAIVEAAGGLSCDLSDLTPEGAGGPSEVQNLLSGASVDGSSVYFVANGVLAGAPAGVVRGDCRPFIPLSATCNLYLYREGRTRFIATLGAADEGDWGSSNSQTHSLGDLTARVSPNGRFLVFMSTRSLTGYDNRDVRSGMPDTEVFLYDAKNETLSCVSCNPTGQRPGGVAGSSGEDLAALHRAGGGGDAGEWFAGNIPTGTPTGGFGESLYMSRVVSDEGRVFFDSSDALVPQDVNGTEDVYEFEPAGVGDCDVSSSRWVASAGGCVGLVSSGTSSGESGFMDASENGEDVFFVTSERLVAGDVDTALDVYDAHVCSAAVPCFASVASSPACVTADACRAASSPQPPIFGAPASSTFSGPGSVSPPVGGGVPAPRSLTLSQKLTRALKTCARRRGRRSRVVCDRRARKRYAAKGARKAGATNGRGA